MATIAEQAKDLSEAAAKRLPVDVLAAFASDQAALIHPHRPTNPVKLTAGEGDRERGA